MRRPRPEPHSLVGAYALDAITGADRARFERHLATCQACAGELRGLREATAGLAEAVAASPAAEVIDRTVAASARTRQLPAVDRAPAWRAFLRVHRARARWVPASKRAWRPAPRRLALGLAVVFLAAAAASGAVALSAEHHLSTARLSDHAIAEVLNAPDAVLLTSRVTAGGTATVVMSRRDRALVFTTAGLPALSAGRYYQLWLMGPAGDRPAGVLPAPDRGMTSLVIATGVTAGDWVGLTVEPAPPARHRTSKPILMLSLAA